MEPTLEIMFYVNLTCETSLYGAQTCKWGRGASCGERESHLSCMMFKFQILQLYISCLDLWIGPTGGDVFRSGRLTTFLKNISYFPIWAHEKIWW